MGSRVGGRRRTLWPGPVRGFGPRFVPAAPGLRRPACPRLRGPRAPADGDLQRPSAVHAGSPAPATVVVDPVANAIGRLQSNHDNSRIEGAYTLGRLRDAPGRSRTRRSAQERLEQGRSGGRGQRLGRDRRPSATESLRQAVSLDKRQAVRDAAGLALGQIATGIRRVRAEPHWDPDPRRTLGDRACPRDPAPTSAKFTDVAAPSRSRSRPTRRRRFPPPPVSATPLESESPRPRGRDCSNSTRSKQDGKESDLLSRLVFLAQLACDLPAWRVACDLGDGVEMPMSIRDPEFEPAGRASPRCPPSSACRWRPSSSWRAWSASGS